MTAIEMRGVSDIEMPHEFGKVAEWCFYKQVIMVGHQNKAMDYNFVVLYRM